MIIIGVEWISGTGDEAIVVVAGERTEVAVFSHPYYRKVGDTLNEPLHLLGATSVKRSGAGLTSAKRHKEKLRYELRAVLKDKNAKILEVDGLLFELEDPIPPDIENGELVELSCSRIDLW